MHSIFQIRISRNTKYVDKISFTRDLHENKYMIYMNLLKKHQKFTYLTITTACRYGQSSVSYSNNVIYYTLLINFVQSNVITVTYYCFGKVSSYFTHYLIIRYTFSNACLKARFMNVHQ